MDTLFEPEDAGTVRSNREESQPSHPSRPAGSGTRPANTGGGPAPEGESRPLAVRVRPTHLEEFVGQTHLLGEGSALRTAIEQAHNPHSMILYGPPGSGKTTLARMVAERSRAVFEELSAVQAGRAEVRGVLERAAHRRATSGMGTVFFLDEIHRFNKAQQDTLLPAVEEGVVTLIGATTENPAFEVNGALLSRMRVYALQALSAEEVGAVLRRALASGELDASLAGEAGGEEEGRSKAGTPSGETDDGPAAASGGIAVAPQTLEFLAARSEGDARTALNALELAVETAAELGERSVGIARAEDALQRRAVLYDRKGDRHYDYISAWIKATRGSDPDASLYYLAVMLEGGEDPRFIVRRMVILASEDIGNADPTALGVAVAAAQAVEHVGMPEAKFALAQAAIYLSLAPKSNAAGRALGAAQRHVREHGATPVPGWLRSGPRPGQEVGGYDYPHDRPGHISPQELLPEEAAGERFYAPDEAEAELARRLAQVRRARGR
jgi:putative ATPase